MFDFLGDAFGAILGGGATGLLGTVVQSIMELKKVMEMNRHEEKLEEMAQESIRLEAEYRLKQTETEAEAAERMAEVKLTSDSYQHDRASYVQAGAPAWVNGLLGVVDFLRGIIRPGATIYLLILMTIVYFDMLGMVNGLDGAIAAEQAAQTVHDVVMMVLYLSSAVTLWWFGARQKPHAIRGV